MGGELFSIIFKFLLELFGCTTAISNDMYYFNDFTECLIYHYSVASNSNFNYWEDIVQNFCAGSGIAAEEIGTWLFCGVLTTIIIIVLICLLFKLFKRIFNLIFKLFRLN